MIMSEKEFIRKRKEDKPVVAICYDFDKTLSPDDMQSQGFIQSVGWDVPKFWQKSNGLAEKNDMDQNLAYMYMMSEEGEGKVWLTKSALAEYGSRINLFPGVETWFKRIEKYAEDKGVIVEHYIISSGLKEMIEGISIAKYFEKIYASSFYYNDKGVAVWPAQVVNYTNKTQFLFRIEKGVLDINDLGVNDYFEPEKIRVPFRNMVYIGDSDTDIPCMKLVNSHGGHSIGVYNNLTNNRVKVYKMMHDKRIKYFVPADYNEGSELDKLVKAIIDRTVTNEVLENIYYSCKKEYIEVDKSNDEDKRKKTDLLIGLENSSNFATTHYIIRKMKKVENWTEEEKEILLKIAVENSQVFSILGDWDLKTFYEDLISEMENLNENAKIVQEEINK